MNDEEVGANSDQPIDGNVDQNQNPLRRLAIITTCHDRREVSFRTLAEALHQATPYFDVRVFAVDDGSSDGTAIRLRGLGQRVEVLQGDGSLFWAGGMRVASRAAEEWGGDFYLWLNDDILIRPDVFRSIHRRLASLTLREAAALVMVGEIADASGEVQYGCRTQSQANKLAFRLSHPTEPVDTYNGNFVLFGAQAYETVGGVPGGYRHGYADYVVGLRASRAGLRIERTPEVAGEDSGGLKELRMFDANVSFRRRIAAARHFTGLPPRDQWRFCLEVVGPLKAPFYFARSYLRVVYPKSARIRRVRYP